METSDFERPGLLNALLNARGDSESRPDATRRMIHKAPPSSANTSKIETNWRRSICLSTLLP
jgi:hypothetical protein